MKQRSILEAVNATGGRAAEQRLRDLLDQALRLADGQAAARVADLRSRYPHDTPAQVNTKLEREFEGVVTLLGAGTGAAAAAPGVGLVAALGVSGGDLMGFVSAAAVHVLASARVRGVHLDDLDTESLERRRAVLMAVLLGSTGSKVVLNTTSRVGSGWARAVLSNASMQILIELNRRLGGLLLRRFAPWWGLASLLKFVPMGVGAALGGMSNFGMAKQILAATRDGFGELPSKWADPPGSR